MCEIFHASTTSETLPDWVTLAVCDCRPTAAFVRGTDRRDHNNCLPKVDKIPGPLFVALDVARVFALGCGKVALLGDDKVRK
jgi:hypothetical protein